MSSCCPESTTVEPVGRYYIQQFFSKRWFVKPKWSNGAILQLGQRRPDAAKNNAIKRRVFHNLRSFPFIFSFIFISSFHFHFTIANASAANSERSLADNVTRSGPGASGATRVGQRGQLTPPKYLEGSALAF